MTMPVQNGKTVVLIYVLNWNQPDLTLDCVNSLLDQKGDIESKITIIDNGSADDSIEIFQKELPETIAIISNQKNLGFQGGMNTGISDALQKDAEFILLLNNDTVADPYMLDNLVNRFPEDAGLVSPLMLYYDHPDRAWSIGGKINLVFLEITKPYQEFLPIPEKILERDFLPSCAWLIKRTVFETVGYLDERFFPIYYDDLDFCLRVRRAGFRIYLIPQAKLWHKVSLSVGGQYSPTERYLMARNSGYYFRKNMRCWQAPLIFLYRLGSAFLWTFRLIIKGNMTALKSYWKGFFEGWFVKLEK